MNMNVFNVIRISVLGYTLFFAVLHPNATASKFIFTGFGMNIFDYVDNGFKMYTSDPTLQNNTPYYTSKPSNALGVIFGDIIPIQSSEGTFYFSIGDMFILIGFVFSLIFWM